MANTSQAEKRARQAEKRRMQNSSVKSKMRTQIKKVIAAVEAKNLEVAKSEFKKAESVLDWVVTKGVIHKNKASRSKSRLSAKVKALAS